MHQRSICDVDVRYGHDGVGPGVTTWCPAKPRQDLDSEAIRDATAP